MLGVDPDKPAHFFDDREEMKDYCIRLKQYINGMGLKQYENMVPKGNKYNTIDVYLYALKDYLFRKKSVSLFVGFKSSMLYPRIPAYFD